MTLTIANVSPTAMSNCGIGNFSMNMNDAMNELGKASFIVDPNEFPIKMPSAPDVIIVQHELSWINENLINTVNFLKSLNEKAIVLLLVHTELKHAKKENKKEIKELDLMADGYIQMCQGMVDDGNFYEDAPVLTIDCPGFFIDDYTKKEVVEMRRRYNISEDSYVIGNFSMVSGHRSVRDIINRVSKKLRDLINRKEITLFISSPVNVRSGNSAEITESYTVLQNLEKIGIIKYTDNFHRRRDRFLMMRMCDLLWCWSDASGIRYASASCSDMYCSGTRMVVANILQHRAVVAPYRNGYYNIVKCGEMCYYPEMQKDTTGILLMCNEIVKNALKKKRTKHSGKDLTFKQFCRELVFFANDIMEEKYDT